MMNATIEKFGYPGTLLHEYEHWVVLLRPQQPTLAAMVLAAKSDAEAFADLTPDAFAELGRVVADIEQVLGAAVAFERVNYLMLMMVDRHVHFHVLPRYEGSREACGVAVPDAGWPEVPDLGTAVTIGPQEIGSLTAWLRDLWP